MQGFYTATISTHEEKLTTAHKEKIMIKSAIDKIRLEGIINQYELQDHTGYSNTKFYHFKNKLLLNPLITQVGNELRFNNSIQLSLETDQEIIPRLEEWELEL